MSEGTDTSCTAGFAVILDEIDGAMASGEGGLAKLVKMISETGKQRYIKQKMVRCLHYHRHHCVLVCGACSHISHFPLTGCQSKEGWLQQ